MNQHVVNQKTSDDRNKQKSGLNQKTLDKNLLNTFPHKLPKRSPPLHSEEDPSTDPLKASLRDLFKFNTFRSALQESACRAAFESQSDVFVCMPTGAGEFGLAMFLIGCYLGVE